MINSKVIISTIKNIVNHPLNREKKINSFLRFLKWQIGSRLIQGSVICEWINGSKLIASPGEHGVTGNIYCGLHEFEDMAYVLHVLRKDDVFFDVGANVGSYTILASAVVGAKSYCFEPIPSTFERLLNNIYVNKINEKVKFLNIGLGEKEGTVHFTESLNTCNHVVAKEEQLDNSIEVNIFPLDNYSQQEVPSVIKIDVEGFETLVLKGAEHTLKSEKLHTVIMELNGSGKRYGFEEDSILEMMKGYGFGTYAYDPFSRELISLKGKNNNRGNTLFIRNIDYVNNRVKSSPKVFVNGNKF